MEWVTMGFWNDMTGPGCLFVEDYTAKKGNYAETNKFKYPSGDYCVFYIDSEAEFAT